MAEVEVYICDWCTREQKFDADADDPVEEGWFTWEPEGGEPEDYCSQDCWMAAL